MRISLKAENLLLSCFQLSVAAGLVKGGPAGNLCPVGDGAWRQGLALQHGSDCLGERLASQEAGVGWSSGPVRLGKHPQDKGWEGKNCSTGDELAQNKPGLTSCLYRCSCSLGSKRPCKRKAQGREGGKKCVAVP